MDLDEFVDVGTLAQALDLTSRRVYQLIEEGVIPRPKRGNRGRYLFRDANHGYIRYLRGQALGDAGAASLNEGRTRFANAQAERIEIQIQEKRRELAPMSLIVETIAKCSAAACDVLDGIPLAVKRRAPGADPRLLKVVEDEVYKARTIAASAKIPEPSE